MLSRKGMFEPQRTKIENKEARVGKAEKGGKRKQEALPKSCLWLTVVSFVKYTRDHSAVLTKDTPER